MSLGNKASMSSLTDHQLPVATQIGVTSSYSGQGGTSWGPPYSYMDFVWPLDLELALILNKSQSWAGLHLEQVSILNKSQSWAGLHLEQVLCTHSHNHCEFMCATALSCPASSVLLQMSIPSGSYILSIPSPVMIPEPWGQNVWFLSPVYYETLYSLLLSACWPMWLTV